MVPETHRNQERGRPRLCDVSPCSWLTLCLLPASRPCQGLQDHLHAGSGDGRGGHAALSPGSQSQLCPHSSPGKGAEQDQQRESPAGPGPGDEGPLPRAQSQGSHTVRAVRTRAEGCPPVLWGLGTRVFPGGWSHGHPLPSTNPNSRPPKSTETGVGTHCWGTANLSLRLWGRLGPSQHVSPDTAWAPQPITFGGTAPWAPNPPPPFSERP